MPLSNEYDLKIKLAEYKILQEDINKYSQKESIENVNYFTELIYICFYCLFEDNLKRINKSDRFWYLDGLTPNGKRTKNPWNVNIKEYFTYDISGQPIVLDEEEMKEKTDNKKKYVNNTSSSGKYNKPITPKRFDNSYDIESNSIDSQSDSSGLKKLNKNEIMRDIIMRENERLNENKQLFVKEKIANCLENNHVTFKNNNEFV